MRSFGLGQGSQHTQDLGSKTNDTKISCIAIAERAQRAQVMTRDMQHAANVPRRQFVQGE